VRSNNVRKAGESSKQKRIKGRGTKKEKDREKGGESGTEEAKEGARQRQQQ
jgi:hypothetical protein